MQYCGEQLDSNRAMQYPLPRGGGNIHTFQNPNLNSLGLDREITKKFLHDFKSGTYNKLYMFECNMAKPIEYVMHLGFIN